MKTMFAVAALLAGSVSAFADHTQFVARRPEAPTPVSNRLPSPYPAYSRSLPRVLTAAPARANETPPGTATGRHAPYNRSNARVPSHRA